MTHSLHKFALPFFIILASAGMDSSYAAGSSKFDCVLTDQKATDTHLGPTKSSFTATTPAIYLYCTAHGGKKGDSINAVWVANDTHNAAPANFEIDHKELKVSADVPSSEAMNADFSLSKPTAGWPVGTYHVELRVNNKLQQSFPFSIA